MAIPVNRPFNRPYLVFNPLSRVWRAPASPPLRVVHYIGGMCGFALALPVRVTVFALQVIVAVVALVANLVTCYRLQNHHFWGLNVRLLSCGAAFAEILTCVVGIFLPTVAYGFEEAIESVPTINQNSPFGYWRPGRPGRGQPVAGAVDLEDGSDDDVFDEMFHIRRGRVLFDADGNAFIPERDDLGARQDVPPRRQQVGGEPDDITRAIAASLAQPAAEAAAREQDMLEMHPILVISFKCGFDKLKEFYDNESVADIAPRTIQQSILIGFIYILGNQYRESGKFGLGAEFSGYVEGKFKGSTKKEIAHCISSLNDKLKPPKNLEPLIQALTLIAMKDAAESKGAMSLKEHEVIPAQKKLWGGVALPLKRPGATASDSEQRDFDAQSDDMKLIADYYYTIRDLSERVATDEREFNTAISKLATQ